jgi:hypothetical protein
MSSVACYTDRGVILLAEFCKCGSIIINNQCSNKNCTFQAAVKTAPTGQKASGSSKSKEPKTTRTRRASKVITYNLYDTKDENNE